MYIYIGKDKAVSVSALKGWDYVKDLIEDGVVSKNVYICIWYWYVYMCIYMY
jgi:hypothetical protein